MRRHLLFIFAIIFLFSCKKDNTKPANNTNTDQFTVSFASATNTNVTDFILTGSLQVTSASQDIEYGFVFSSFSDPSIYQGKVIGVGKSQKTLNYNYTLTDLDPRLTYYCRAYALQNDKVVYSSIFTVGKHSLAITSVSSDTLSSPDVLTIITNFKNLTPTDQVSIYLGTTAINVSGTNAADTSGMIYYVNYPTQLPSGVYALSIKLNNIIIPYTKNITLLAGKWTDVGQLSYAQVVIPHETFGFVKDGWIYSYRLLVKQYPEVTTTQFIKQNIQSGQVVNLTTFDSDTFIFGAGIVYEGNLIHFIGGEEYDKHTTACVNSHYIYNTDNDTWTKVADFPGTVRTGAVTMLYNNKIYYGMGYRIGDPNNTNSAEADRNDMWTYDLQTRQWQQLAATFPQDGRSHSTYFSIGSKIYMVAGYDRITPQHSTWCFDAQTNTWSQKADYPGPGYEDDISFQFGQYGYVGVGSYETSGGPAGVNNFYRYDPVNDKWIRISTPVYTAFYMIAGANGQSGVIAGGFAPYGAPQDIYVFTP